MAARTAPRLHPPSSRRDFPEAPTSSDRPGHPKVCRDQRDIEKTAHEKERERDDESHRADQLLKQHRRFANSVAFIQVAIALGDQAAP